MNEAQKKGLHMISEAFGRAASDIVGDPGHIAVSCINVIVVHRRGEGTGMGNIFMTHPPAREGQEDAMVAAILNSAMMACLNVMLDRGALPHPEGDCEGCDKTRAKFRLMYGEKKA